jgi:hypothetical protein
MRTFVVPAGLNATDVRSLSLPIFFQLGWNGEC